ncbi:MAG: hypothetical protein CVV22_00785 [Ignavibacteriae bacterium HGW-Ignavibacteriae-1]|jgi:hypothetical protein|nr:MAG: hypothetical protein CVV22_00785 [Ignavibacteriae bacterium HGW-Ignavibacteriae-1]
MKKLSFKENIIKFGLLTALIFLSISLNSCEDTFGTDPYVKKVPIDPIDTTKPDKQIFAKELLWRFKEIARANQITEWPNSITYINNSLKLDTSNGRVFIWLDLEMKANFFRQSGVDDKVENADRVEYLKIKIDSVEIIPNQSFSLNSIADGRYSRIELFNHQVNKKYSFEGSDLITRMRINYFPEEKKLTGNFVFDFQLIDYIHTVQFLGSFSAFY